MNSLSNIDLQLNNTKTILIYAISLIVTISGLFCFIINENWIINWYFIPKILIIISISISLSYITLFSIIDFVNLILSFC